MRIISVRWLEETSEGAARPGEKSFLPKEFSALCVFRSLTSPPFILIFFPLRAFSILTPATLTTTLAGRLSSFVRARHRRAFFFAAKRAKGASLARLIVNRTLGQDGYRARAASCRLLYVCLSATVRNKSATEYKAIRRHARNAEKAGPVLMRR